MGMKPVKVAILRFDNGHVRPISCALKDDPMFEIVAVSYSPLNPVSMGRSFMKDLPFYYDDEQLLNEHPEVELAVCGGTNRMHLNQFRLCAERGIHVISMKVPTMDMDEYAEMLKLQKEHGIQVAIELEMRWRAEILRIKDLIKSGAIGKPLSLNAYNYSHFPMWWNPWMNIPEEIYGKRVKLKPNDPEDCRYRGGALTDHPHIFDLARFIFESDYDFVYAEAAPNMRYDAEVEDLLTITGRLKNGVIFSLDPSYGNKEKQIFKTNGGDDFCKYPRCVEVELAVHGEKGSIIANVYGAKAYQSMYLPSEDFKHWGSSGASFSDYRRIFLRNFVRKIRGENVDAGTTLSEHVNIIKVMNAAYDSMATGKIIKL
ncbi:MAG: Gfo/Idh/MocA family oxidoreductase [Candidatus Borkfalkiaceae bacterium]|nr:Gfo/Idh/MocA family oxidoreductase [Christensenellaceae bacterium]